MVFVSVYGGVFYLDEGLVKLPHHHLHRQGGHDHAGELFLKAVAEPHEVLEPPDHSELPVVEVWAVGARVDLCVGARRVLFYIKARTD